jgi:hypothetical protein
MIMVELLVSVALNPKNWNGAETVTFTGQPDNLELAVQVDDAGHEATTVSVLFVPSIEDERPITYPDITAEVAAPPHLVHVAPCTMAYRVPIRAALSTRSYWYRAVANLKKPMSTRMINGTVTANSTSA